MLPLRERRARPLDEDEIIFRREALRDALLCNGWMKILTIFVYLLLYFLVLRYGQAEMSYIIQIMLLVSIMPTTLLGTFLVMSALGPKKSILTSTLWLCILMGFNDFILGILGCFYFIRKANLTANLVIALIFSWLACSGMFEVMLKVLRPKRDAERETTVTGTRTVEQLERELNENIRRSKKHAVLFNGFMKLTSIFVYLLLYTLIHQFGGEGNTPRILGILLMISIVPTTVLGMLLILAALGKTWVLTAALLLCGALGLCDFSLGIFGAIYFVRKLEYTINVAIALLFLYLTCTGICVLCCDVWRVRDLQKSTTEGT